MKKVALILASLIACAMLVPSQAYAVPVVKNLIVKEEPWVDVRAYGMSAEYPWLTTYPGTDPAGYADQSPLLQAAIDAATDNGTRFGRVFVPFPQDGLNYLLKTTVTLKTGLELICGNPSHQWSGATGSKDAFVFYPSDNTTNMMEFGGAYAGGYNYGLVMRDCTFVSLGHGSSSPGTYELAGNYALVLNSPGKARFHNLQFISFTRGLRIAGAIDTAFYDLNVSGALYNAVEFRGTDLSGTNTPVSTTVRFFGGYLHGSSGWCIVSEDAIETALFGTILESCDTGGVDLYRGNTITMSNIYSEYIAHGNPTMGVTGVAFLRGGVSGTSGNSRFQVFGGRIESHAHAFYLDYDKGSQLTGGKINASYPYQALTTTANTKTLNWWGNYLEAGDTVIADTYEVFGISTQNTQTDSFPGNLATDMTIPNTSARGTHYWLETPDNNVVITLPPTERGMELWFAVKSARTIRLKPDAADSFVLDDTVLTAGNKIYSGGTAGEWVHIRSTAPTQAGGHRWWVLDKRGTWVDGGAP